MISSSAAGLALLLPCLLAAAPAKTAPTKSKPPAAKPAAKGPAAKPAAPAKDPSKAEVTTVDVELEARDPARTAAEQLLASLSKQTGEEGLKVLLGGPSLVSRLFSIENWKVVGREKRRVETGDLGAAKKLLAALDLERRKANRELVSAPLPATGPAGAKGEVALSGVSGADDAWTFELVRDAGRQLEEAHPVLGFLLGADRAEHGYANDPLRKLLTRTPRRGKYSVELDQLWIETREGNHEDTRARRWPLYVLRLKAGRFDSGVKVLPTVETTGANAADVCR